MNLKKTQFLGRQLWILVKLGEDVEGSSSLDRVYSKGSHKEQLRAVLFRR